MQTVRRQMGSLHSTFRQYFCIVPWDPPVLSRRSRIQLFPAIRVRIYLANVAHEISRIRQKFCTIQAAVKSLTASFYCIFEITRNRGE